MMKQLVLVIGEFILVSLLITSIGFSAQLDKDDFDKLKQVVFPLHPLQLHGTEYNDGDIATPFVQFVDNKRVAVINGSCYIDIFYPNKTNAISNAPMLYIPNSDGIYFYTYAIPSGLIGVYPMSARCIFSQTVKWFYTYEGWNPFGETCEKEVINITSFNGTLSGAPVVMNSPNDWLFVEHDSINKFTNATLTFNATNSSCKINRSMSTLDFYFMGEAENRVLVTFYFWNWNSSRWDIDGTFIANGLAGGGGLLGVPDFFTKSLYLPNYTASDGTAKVMITTFNSTKDSNIYYDWIAFKTVGNSTSVIELKGSGELHASTSSAQSSGLDANQNATLYAIQSISIQVNSTLNESVIPKLENISSNVDTAIAMLTNLPSQIWNYTTRTLTSFGTLVSDIWSYMTRELTDNIPAEVWNYTTRTLTESNFTCINCNINISESTCAVSVPSAAYHKDYYPITIISGSTLVPISYTIYDENANLVSSSDTTSGSNIYTFKQYASQYGTFAIVANCGTSSDTASVIISRKTALTAGSPITGQSLSTVNVKDLSLGYRIAIMGLVSLGVGAACAKIRYVLVYAGGGIILIYLFFILFI
jgi:hypothetical protein